MNDPHTDKSAESHDGSGQIPPRAPRWVYVLAIITAVLVLAFIAFHLAGGGLGRHGTVSGAVSYIVQPS